VISRIGRAKRNAPVPLESRDLDEIHRRDAEMLGREMGLPPDQALREFDRLHQLSQTPWSR
jgi:hypothetical protein